MLYRVGQKNDPTCFRQNFAKSPPNLIVFDVWIAKMMREREREREREKERERERESLFSITKSTQ